jgi:hypothetical protein
LIAAARSLTRLLGDLFSAEALHLERDAIRTRRFARPN